MIAGRSDVWGAPTLRLDDVSVPGQTDQKPKWNFSPDVTFWHLTTPYGAILALETRSAWRDLGVGGPAERRRHQAPVALGDLLAVPVLGEEHAGHPADLHGREHHLGEGVDLVQGRPGGQRAPTAGGAAASC